MATQNHQIILSHELHKNGGKISIFWNQEIKEIKENSENQNIEKSTSTSRGNSTKIKCMALDDWISQVVV